jgi:hypothetical protein
MLPYCSPYPYSTTIVTEEETYPDHVPKIKLEVINPLRAPETCAQNISLIFEFAGGPDFEVAVPSDRQEYPYVNDVMIAAQGADDDVSCDKVIAKPIGGGTIKESDVVFASACVGEKIVSMLQLAKRFTKTAVNNDIFTSFRPDIFRVVYQDDPVIGFSNVGPGPDLLTRVALCYRLSRGGIRFKAYQSTVDTNQPWKAYIEDSRNSFGMTNTADFQHYSSSVYSSANSCGMIEVSVPQYLGVISRLNRTCSSDYAPPVDFFSSRQRVAFVNSSGQQKWYYRAAADDTTFGAFIGVPAMATTKVE